MENLQEKCILFLKSPLQRTGKNNPTSVSIRVKQGDTIKCKQAKKLLVRVHNLCTLVEKSL